MQDFKVMSCDTDAIMFTKKDESPISEEERKLILEKVNALYPSRIRFEDDGYYPSIIVFKAKNYVMKTEDGKIKIKGSALKDAKKEIALKEFQKKIIDGILEGREDFKDIYESYVKEIMDVKDISRWASKKTITEKVMDSPRLNEEKVRNVIAGTEYREGDKVYVYFKSDESLGLVETFDGDYHKVKFLKKLHTCTKLFDEILPTKELFINYSLKKNYKLMTVEPERQLIHLTHIANEQQKIK